MSGLGEVRALLAAFGHSPWRELYVRSGDWTLFLGKPGAAASPLRAAPAPAEATAPHVLTAPHLGTFHALATHGERVALDQAIGTLAVLDRLEEVRAPIAGTLVDLPAEGALVEYGAPLAAIAA